MTIYVTRTVLGMEVEDVRPRGRPKTKMHGHNKEKYQEEWADGRQHS